jgi:hypothetical protein
MGTMTLREICGGLQSVRARDPLSKRKIASCSNSISKQAIGRTVKCLSCDSGVESYTIFFLKNTVESYSR